MSVGRNVRESRRVPLVVLDMSNHFTQREKAIARLVAEDMLNKQIAHRLDISEQTVKNHISHILQKLGAQTRVGIAREVLIKPDLWEDEDKGGENG